MKEIIKEDTCVHIRHCEESGDEVIQTNVRHAEALIDTACDGLIHSASSTKVQLEEMPNSKNQDTISKSELRHDVKRKNFFSFLTLHASPLIR